MRAPLPFRSFREVYEPRFGRPLHRVALDAGSDCPNRDGSKGRGGCAYCDVEGSGTGALKSGLEIREQLERGIARVRRRAPECGVVAYLQSYSNTYVAEQRLREVLAALEGFVAPARASAPLEFPVVALSIATRPDTLPEWALALLVEWNQRLPVWVELGLEAADDALLAAIHRFHTVAEFRDCARRVHAAGLELVGHAILGLPGDGRAGARRTAEVLADEAVSGVKLHQLMVLRRTQFEKRWRAGEIATLDEREYFEWLADVVERLRPEQVLHRLAGDAAPADLLAPDWTLARLDVRARLAEVLNRRGTRQGSARAGAR